MKLRDYQLDAVLWLWKKPRALLALDMGLG